MAGSPGQDVGSKTTTDKVGVGCRGVGECSTVQDEIGLSGSGVSRESLGWRLYGANSLLLARTPRAINSLGFT